MVRLLKPNPLLVVLFVLCFFLANDIRSEDFERIFQWGNKSYVHVLLDNGRAYLVGDEDLDVIDVSDPNRPFKMGNLNLQSHILDTLIEQNIAYIASGRELLVYDFSNPSQPRKLTTIPSQGYPICLQLEDNYLLVGVDTNKIMVVDVSNPAQPRLAGSCDLPGKPANISIDEGIVGITLSNVGWVVVDVQRPDQPRLLALVSKSNSDISVGPILIAGGVAYVGDIFGISVFDLTIPEHPSQVTRKETPFTIRNMSIEDGILVIASGDAGIFLWDMSDPANPETLSDVPAVVFASEVALLERRAYVAAGEGGLLIIDISDPQAAHQIGQLSGSTDTSKIVACGNYRYLAGVTLGIVDLSNPNEPRMVGSIDTGAQISDIAIHDQFLFLCTNGLFQVADIANPESPMPVSSLPVNAYLVRLEWPMAYLVGWENRLSYLFMVDISVPSQPALLGKILAGYSQIDSLWSKEGIVFVHVRNMNSLSLFDVADPQAPVFLNEISFPLVRQFDGAGDYLYAACDWNGVQILDVHDPRNPSRIAEIKARDADAISVGENFLYFIDTKNSSLEIYDISSPILPKWVGFCGNQGTRDRLHVEDGLALVFGGDELLNIVDVSQPVNPPVIGHFDYGGPSTFLAVGGDKMVTTLGDPPQWLSIVDVGCPYNPLFGCYYVLPDYQSARALCLEGDYLFITGSKDLMILDVSSASSPVHVCTFTPTLSEFYVKDQMGYGLDNSGLIVFSLADPANLVILGRCSTTSLGIEIEVREDKVYVLEDLHLEIFDVSTPANPILVGTVPINPHYGSVRGLALMGPYALFTVPDGLYTGYLGIIDISDPGSAHYEGLYSLNSTPGKVVVDDYLAFILEGENGVKVVDLSYPAFPEEVGWINYGNNLVDAKICDGLLYLLDKNYGVVDFIRIFTPGDLNQDGQIDVIDASILDNYLVGNLSAGEMPFLASLNAADYSADCSVDAKDSLLVKQYIAGNM